LMNLKEAICQEISIYFNSSLSKYRYKKGTLLAYHYSFWVVKVFFKI
jgi:hypothetical protein